MSKIKTFVQNQLKKVQTNPLWRLFLKGVEGQFSAKNPKPYNFYTKIIGISAPLLVIYYILQFKKNEMDIHGHNLLVPKYVYKVREQNYIYWQTVRIAKGMPTFLTYYKWDQNLMFQIDKAGKQTPIQTHKGIQNVQTFQSPLHQYNFPASAETHSKILMYLKNLNNPYNLQNYLRFRPVTMGDWLRAGYYIIYRELGLTNRWRYDEYVRKPDIYYRIEKIRHAFRLSRDRESLYKVIDKLRQEIVMRDVVSYLIWFL